MQQSDINLFGAIVDFSYQIQSYLYSDNNRPFMTILVYSVIII